MKWIPKSKIGKILLAILVLWAIGFIGNLGSEPVHDAPVVKEQVNSYGMTENEMKATRQVWEQVVKDNPEEAAAHGWT